MRQQVGRAERSDLVSGFTTVALQVVIGAGPRACGERGEWRPYEVQVRVESKGDHALVEDKDMVGDAGAGSSASRWAFGAALRRLRLGAGEDGEVAELPLRAALQGVRLPAEGVGAA